MLQVFTCGDNSSFCCGHRDTGRPIFRPRLVEALKGVPCKQVKYMVLLLKETFTSMPIKLVCEFPHCIN